MKLPKIPFAVFNAAVWLFVVATGIASLYGAYLFICLRIR